MCFFLVCLICKTSLRAASWRLFAFSVPGVAFVPVADVPQLLQISCTSVNGTFSLRFREKVSCSSCSSFCGTVPYRRVLGKVVSGFHTGQLRVFLFEFLLCFLKKYLLVLSIDSLTFLCSLSAGKNPSITLCGLPLASSDCGNLRLISRKIPEMLLSPPQVESPFAGDRTGLR